MPFNGPLNKWMSFRHCVICSILSSKLGILVDRNFSGSLVMSMAYLYGQNMQALVQCDLCTCAYRDLRTSYDSAHPCTPSVALPAFIRHLPSIHEVTQSHERSHTLSTRRLQHHVRPPLRHAATRSLQTLRICVLIFIVACYNLIPHDFTIL